MLLLLRSYAWENIWTIKECIPVGCVPPAAVAVWGGSPPGTLPWTMHVPLGPGTPLPLDQAPPRPGTPLDQAPPGPDTPPAPGPPLSTEFLTHACENITLPQTSFAGGKKWPMTRTYGNWTPLYAHRSCHLTKTRDVQTRDYFLFLNV